MSIWNSNDKFKNKYRIPSARAKWHNYNDGCFFITFCTKNRMPYFGRITCQQMHYTIIGKYAHECVNRIMELHPDVTVSGGTDHQRGISHTGADSSDTVAQVQHSGCALQGYAWAAISCGDADTLEPRVQNPCLLQRGKGLCQARET